MLCLLAILSTAAATDWWREGRSPLNQDGRFYDPICFWAQLKLLNQQGEVIVRMVGISRMELDILYIEENNIEAGWSAIWSDVINLSYFHLTDFEVPGVKLRPDVFAP